MAYCPEWESDPELIQAGVVWPGTSTFLSYAFNARTQLKFATLESGFVAPFVTLGGVVSGRALTPEQFVQPAVRALLHGQQERPPGLVCDPAVLGVHLHVLAGYAGPGMVEYLVPVPAPSRELQRRFHGRARGDVRIRRVLRCRSRFRESLCAVLGNL